MPSESQTNERKRWSVVRLASAVFVLIGIGVLSCTLFARWLWWCELLSHFRPQLVIIFSIGIALTLIQRQWIISLCGVLAMSPTLWMVASFYVPPKAASPRTNESHQQTLKVGVANILSLNTDHQPTLDWARQVSADVYIFAEVDSTWTTSLDALSDIYPHSTIAPREENFGMAVLSRIPLKSTRFEWLDANGSVAVVVTLDDPFEDLQMIGVHLSPPLDPAMWQSRTVQYDRLIELTNLHQGPIVVAGDFNSTPWTPDYHRFVQETSLRDAQKGFGWFGTWPKQWPLLLIPLDHVFISKEIGVEAYERGPDLGSDHYPIIIDLSATTTDTSALDSQPAGEAAQNEFQN